ncbi:hypothetical protein PAPYR_2793 [Paratrimastix pyriformis]|uniref:Uncharacterized protein n=1 Tax=Paratrimastix pyriformis TaxID=342808 RepID=A0ABQ8UP35_9EUKA|nr:hypothetical protein PAPYR_2793 [Paratrimastix pyriformis]
MSVFEEEARRLLTDLEQKKAKKQRAMENARQQQILDKYVREQAALQQTIEDEQRKIRQAERQKSLSQLNRIVRESEDIAYKRRFVSEKLASLEARSQLDQTVREQRGPLAETMATAVRTTAYQARQHVIAQRQVYKEQVERELRKRALEEQRVARQEGLARATLEGLNQEYSTRVGAVHQACQAVRPQLIEGLVAAGKEGHRRVEAVKEDEAKEQQMSMAGLTPALVEELAALQPVQFTKARRMPAHVHRWWRKKVVGKLQQRQREQLHQAAGGGGEGANLTPPGSPLAVDLRSILSQFRPDGARDDHSEAAAGGRWGGWSPGVINPETDQP